MTTDFVDELGLCVLPHHIRRMLDCFRNQEPALAPEGAGEAPGRAHSMMRLLDAHGPLGVVDIAARLRLSHPLIIDFSRKLQAVGLVEESRDPADRRVRWLALTEAGRAEAQRIAGEHERLARAYGALCEEIGVDLLEVSRKLQAALAARSISERLTQLDEEEVSP